MLQYVFHPLAEAELDAAVGHYETIQPGKGLELAHEVESALQRIRRFPESAPIARGQVRALLVQPSTRWSYTLYYSVSNSELRVLAFAHQKRQPFYWFGRR